MKLSQQFWFAEAMLTRRFVDTSHFLRDKVKILHYDPIFRRNAQQRERHWTRKLIQGWSESLASYNFHGSGWASGALPSLRKKVPIAALLFISGHGFPSLPHVAPDTQPHPWNLWCKTFLYSLRLRLKSGSQFFRPPFSEQMVFESNDVKYLCASVRYH